MLLQNLAGEFYLFLKNANQKCKLAEVAKSAKYGYKILAVFCWMQKKADLAD